MKNGLTSLIFLAVVLCGIRASAGEETRLVCAEYKCFQSEVMSTPEGRERGLMSRDGLADDQGMLFIFDEPGDYPFWMKNMNFPIDIIWLDEVKTVVHAELNVPPCIKDPCPVYPPHVKALYVLEIASGEAVASGIKIGEQLTWN